MHRLRRRNEPIRKSLHLARPAVEPQPTQRAVQHTGMAAPQCASAPRRRGQYGNCCAGHQRDPRPASDLTVDHVVPLAAGGALLDISNCAVLCRSYNSTKGGSEGDRRDPQAGSALLEDRASQMYALGGVSREIP